MYGKADSLQGLKKQVVEGKFHWANNGSEENCDFNFNEDGTMVGLGASGTWKIIDDKTVWTKIC